MKKLGLFLFSVLFWPLVFGWMGLLFLLSILLVPFVSYRRVHHWIAAPGFKVCIWLSGNRIRVHYDAEFDPTRPTVFCQNHVNLMDAHVAAASIPQVFCGLMHAWQFKIPIYGWFMQLSKGIPVHPKRRDNLLRMTEAAKKRKAVGYSILTFPEAGRTLNGRIRPFKRGVFAMARDAGFPVTPVAVRNLFLVNQKGSGLFAPGHQIEVWVGRQHETEGRSEEALKGLIAKVEAQVQAFVNEKEHEHA